MAQSAQYYEIELAHLHRRVRATVFAVVVARILFFQILGQGIANVAVIIDDKDMRG